MPFLIHASSQLLGFGSLLLQIHTIITVITVTRRKAPITMRVILSQPGSGGGGVVVAGVVVLVVVGSEMTGSTYLMHLSMISFRCRAYN